MEKDQNLEETRKMMYKFVDEYIDNLKDVDDTLKVQGMVLEVIFEKGVDVGYLKTCKTLEEYNANCWNDEEDVNKKLTQEEFDLVQRYASIYVK